MGVVRRCLIITSWTLSQRNFNIYECSPRVWKAITARKAHDTWQKYFQKAVREERSSELDPKIPKVWRLGEAVGANEVLNSGKGAQDE